MPPSTDLLQGTLDVLILKTLALESMYGWGIALRIQQVETWDRLSTAIALVLKQIPEASS
jgi:hypothetical protein